MPTKIPAREFIKLCKERLLVDVRSPAEYQKGHIPGAVSLPLFTDEERAQVGTLYKQQGREPAIRLGLKLVGPKLDFFYNKVQDLGQGRELAIYCWRGGMRSASLGHFFSGLGFRVVLLEGGYKSYRRHVLADFETLKLPLLVLGGFTGSGKTELLHVLSARGQAVLDLEGLARHKGSAFGTLPDEPQPTQEHFENLLHNTLCELQGRAPVWVEDESAHIGRCQIPKPLFLQMRTAPLVKLELSRELRARRLAREYSALPESELSLAVLRIQKRLGGLRTKECLSALAARDYTKAAEILLSYYDRTYSYGQSKRDPASIHSLEFQEFEKENMVESLMEAAKTISQKALHQTGP